MQRFWKDLRIKNKKIYNIKEVKKMFKYIEIKSILKKIIDNNEPHYKLPSRNEIIKMYNVSDITVRKALEELLREGY